MYAAEDQGTAIAMRSQREMVGTFSRPLPSYPLPFPSSRKRSQFPAFVCGDPTHRRGRMAEGWRMAGLEMISVYDWSLFSPTSANSNLNPRYWVAPPRLIRLTPLVASKCDRGGEGGEGSVVQCVEPRCWMTGNDRSYPAFICIIHILFLSKMYVLIVPSHVLPDHVQFASRPS